MSVAEERAGVRVTNLDQPLSEDSGATKRDLVDYLEAVAERILPGLAGRPLTVLRALRGQAPFMQKSVPKYTPDWVKTVSMWAESSHREVRYALCDDRRTLLWLANQRAVEYHPTLGLADDIYRPTHLVLDLDPPPGSAFDAVVATAALVQQALSECGVTGLVKTSGAKGLHVFVPVDASGPVDDVAAYSPRLRPGTPVSFPVAWSDLDRITPADFSLHTALGVLGDRDPWAEMMPGPQRLPTDLIEHGRTIPVARVAAMHEGKRRARARRAEDGKTSDSPGR